MHWFTKLLKYADTEDATLEIHRRPSLRFTDDSETMAPDWVVIWEHDYEGRSDVSLELACKDLLDTLGKF